MPRVLISAAHRKTGFKITQKNSEEKKLLMERKVPGDQGRAKHAGYNNTGEVEPKSSSVCCLDLIDQMEHIFHIQLLEKQTETVEGRHTVLTEIPRSESSDISAFEQNTDPQQRRWSAIFMFVTKLHPPGQTATIMTLIQVKTAPSSSCRNILLWTFMVLRGWTISMFLPVFCLSNTTKQNWNDLSNV